MVAGIAWPRDRAARMDQSLVRVREFLAGDGTSGLGSDHPARMAARRRALAAGLTSQEGWLVRDALVADARRLMPPGGRVRERAKRVTGAVQEALKAQGGFRMPPGGSLGVLERPGAVPGLPEVGRYAVAEHDWQVEDRVLVAEDLPWAVTDDWRDMRALPATWLGVVADPPALGLSGDSWKQGLWTLGHARPAWADDPAARRRVLAYLRAFGWNGTPLRADLDDVERYLPMARLAPGRGEYVAWLVPGETGVGWCLAWPVLG